MQRFFPILLIVLVLAGCSRFREPEFKGIEQTDIVKPGLKESVVRLRIHFYNPNKSGITLRSASGEAWADGDYLGSFSMDSTMQIAGLSDFELPVLFTADMKTVLKSSLGALSGTDAELKIEGTARVKKGILKLGVPIRYTGKHNMAELLQ